MRPSQSDDIAAVSDLLKSSLRDQDTAWSVGAFGAIAEFIRDAGEPFSEPSGQRIGAVTTRGAVALTPSSDLRPVAYETANPSGWNHAVALCLPEADCAMNRRATLTELGPDRDAARAEDREAILFDLGLDLLAIDACVRACDPETVAALREGVGKPLFDHANPVGMRLVALSPPRVFISRIGRIEVFQPIPPPDGASPEGPHTHVMPKLLAGRRTHAATTPIPDGWVPVAAIHPPHPYKNALGERIAFDRDRHESFQVLLERWGDPGLRAAKAGASDATGKHAHQARRVAEMQARWLRGEVIAPEADPDDLAHTG